MTEAVPGSREPRFAASVLTALTDPQRAQFAADTLKDAKDSTLGSLWKEFLEPGLDPRLSAGLLGVLGANPNPIPNDALLSAWTHCLRRGDMRVLRTLLDKNPLAAGSYSQLNDAVLDCGPWHPIVDEIRAAGQEGGWLTDLLCSTAVSRDSEEARRLAALCTEAGLAPADPFERSAFFLLTGQPDQFRAADPDGTYLATAYRRASEEHQERLRAAMRRAGELDLVRVIAGEASEAAVAPAAAASTEERGYLGERFAERGDWPGLWRLALESSLAEAVLTMGLFQNWRPERDTDRALFERLTEAARNPEILPATGEPTWITPDGRVRNCALSPRGDRVAVLWRDTDQTTRYQLGSFDTRTGECLFQTRHFEANVLNHPQLLHLGEAILVTRGTEDRTKGELLSYSASGGQTLHSGPAVIRLAPTGRGFAATTMDFHLLLGDAKGGEAAQPEAHSLVSPQQRRPDRNAAWALATCPPAGLLALGGNRLRVFTDGGEVVPTPTEPHPADSSNLLAAFAGPDLAFTAPKLKDHITRWVRSAAADAPGFVPDDTITVGQPVLQLSALPTYGAVVSGSGALRVFDPVGLEPVELSAIVDPGGVDSLCHASLGGQIAAAGTRGVEIRSPFAALAFRPRGEITAEELELLRRGRAYAPPGLRGYVELLHAWAEHTSEIALAADEAAGPGLTSYDFEVER